MAWRKAEYVDLVWNEAVTSGKTVFLFHHAETETVIAEDESHAHILPFFKICAAFRREQRHGEFPGVVGGEDVGIEPFDLTLAADERR